ncbi:MAG: putative polymerase subfamily sigma factor [Ilumatobacteraceae bacterium]|nr:putative polymerase subfamily sigma factor [Ilumatobacteraceae bacterium]
MNEDTSFEAFYRASHDWALHLAWLLCGDRALSEDAVQDAYSALLPRFADVENPHGYLRTSIVNSLRTRRRRTMIERQRLELVRPPSEAEQRHSELAGSIARLPYKERVAIVCRYWADLPEDETAAMLGVAPATVRSLIQRAIKRLRLEVEP